MRLRLVVAATFIAATTVLHAQAPPPTTPESLVLAAKRAAGQDYAGTFLRICVAPDNLATGTAGRGGRGAANAVPAARVVPDRATWYAQPYKVFDNLYFIGTRIHSAWALTTSDGIIVIDTLFDYAIEPEIVEGLSGLGLNPRDIKYVVISHAHGDHDQGAALLQSRYGAKVVMGVADWDALPSSNQVQNPTPVLLRFLVALPSVEARGGVGSGGGLGSGERSCGPNPAFNIGEGSATEV
jgi:metallo-beta-lactamase class B